MKIAFFGTSDRSIPILEELNKKFDLVLCVTKADSKIGRHQTTKETAVKKWANQNNVALVTIKSLDDNTKKEIIDQIKALGVTLGIVTDFSFMLPEKIINTPQYSLINIHFSLLPKYRGACPVQFAILNGDKITGITYALIVKKLDAGPILTQITHKIAGNETAEGLYKILFKKAAGGLLKVVKGYINGEITPTPQDETQATYCYSKTHPNKTIIYKEDAKIDWLDSPTQIERQIRAYNPWPISWTNLAELSKHFELRLKQNMNNELRLKIYGGRLEGDILKVDKLQVEGGKIINWEDFVNGYLDS